MACFSCMPDCDKCIPKFIDCPECGAHCTLKDDSCPKCGHPFTDPERSIAKEAWLKDLMVRNKPKKTRVA